MTKTSLRGIRITTDGNGVILGMSYGTALHIMERVWLRNNDCESADFDALEYEQGIALGAFLGLTSGIDKEDAAAVLERLYRRNGDEGCRDFQRLTDVQHRALYVILTGRGAHGLGKANNSARLDHVVAIPQEEVDV